MTSVQHIQHRANLLDHSAPNGLCSHEQSGRNGFSGGYQSGDDNALGFVPMSMTGIEREAETPASEIFHLVQPGDENIRHDGRICEHESFLAHHGAFPLESRPYHWPPSHGEAMRGEDTRHELSHDALIVGNDERHVSMPAPRQHLLEIPGQFTSYPVGHCETAYDTALGLAALSGREICPADKTDYPVDHLQFQAGNDRIGDDNGFGEIGSVYPFSHELYDWISSGGEA